MHHIAPDSQGGDLANAHWRIEQDGPIDGVDSAEGAQPERVTVGTVETDQGTLEIVRTTE